MSEELNNEEVKEEAKPKRERKPSVKILGKSVAIAQDKDVMLAVHAVAIKPFNRARLINVLRKLGIKEPEKNKTTDLAGAYISVIELWEKQGGDPSKRTSSCCGG